MIIFLNGTSSVGKSSLAREIMRQSEIPFVYHASDHILNFWIDSKFVNFLYSDQSPEKWQREWFCRKQYIDKIGQKVVYIRNGQKGWQLYSDLVKAACTLVDKNYDMIIDEVIKCEEQLSLYDPSLSGKKVYLVHIVCNAEVCEEREKQRGDRYVGLSRGLLKNMNHLIPFYDFELDTTTISPQEGAKKVLDFTKSNKNPLAFQKGIELRYSS